MKIRAEKKRTNELTQHIPLSFLKRLNHIFWRYSSGELTSSSSALMQSHKGSIHSPHKILNIIINEWKKSLKFHLKENKNIWFIVLLPIVSMCVSLTTRMIYRKCIGAVKKRIPLYIEAFEKKKIQFTTRVPRSKNRSPIFRP